MAKEHFSKIKAIRYEGPGSDNPLAFRHYNPAEKIGGKTLREQMRFSIAYWHSFRGAGSDPFGPGTIVRRWEKGHDPVSVAKVRMDAAFEFFRKIQAPFYAFHDRDIAPEGRSLAASNRNLDQLVAHAKELQKATGVKLLWGTANLFSHPRYMCGGCDQPGRACLCLRGGAGEEGAGGDQDAGGCELRILGRARGVRDAAQHQPEAGAGAPGGVFAHGGRLRPADRLPGAVFDRAEAEGADQAPVRLRRGQRDRVFAHLRAGATFQVQHRDQPRDAGRAHVPPRDRGGGGRGDARVDRRELGGHAAGLGTPTSSTPTSRS